MTYGSDLPNAFRLVGVYVGRILKGEKPPGRSSNRQSLNSSSTSRPPNALGLTVPNTMQLLADEVIE
jgi:putative ABC transport system substrate-binding protein